MFYIVQWYGLQDGKPTPIGPKAWAEQYERAVALLGEKPPQAIMPILVEKVTKGELLRRELERIKNKKKSGQTPLLKSRISPQIGATV